MGTQIQYRHKSHRLQTGGFPNYNSKQTTYSLITNAKKNKDLQLTKRQSHREKLNLLSNHITYHISRNNPESKT